MNFDEQKELEEKQASLKKQQHLQNLKQVLEQMESGIVAKEFDEIVNKATNERESQPDLATPPQNFRQFVDELSLEKPISKLQIKDLLLSVEQHPGSMIERVWIEQRLSDFL